MKELQEPIKDKINSADQREIKKVKLHHIKGKRYMSWI